MKTSNNKPLRFDTQKNARSMRVKRFAAAFSCFFVLLAGVSFLLLLSFYDFDLSSIGKPVEEQTTEEPTTAAPISVAQGKRSYLLLCTADSSNAIRFAAILQADMDSLELGIKPISPTLAMTADGFTGTAEQQLDFGGNSQLVKAVEAAYNIEIHKYIRSTDSGFKSIIGTVGGYETDVAEAIDIRSESLTAIIGKGKQTMTGDTTLKYIRAFEKSPAKQAEILAELFEQKITPNNFQKADRYYSAIINSVESDISVLDFNQIKNSFEALISSETPVDVKINE